MESEPSVQPPAGAPPHPPRLVALLRTPYLVALSAIAAQLRADFPDLRPAHFIVFQLIAHPPAGSRLTELAQGARMTKPAMLELVDALERGDYVERVPDPRDRRAKLIRLTPRGVAAYDAGLRAVDALETAWAARLGADRFAVLLTLLRELGVVLERDGAVADGDGSATAVARLTSRT